MAYPCPATAAPALSWRQRCFDGISVGRARALIELSKPRLAVMSVLTTAVAYEATHAGRPAHAMQVIGGTLLSAAGALALNEWRERDTDALMKRTRTRPLPAQELTATTALTWSISLSVLGVAWLALAANPLAAAASAATIAIYAFIYTPLKRRARWATEVGAISGALPPLIGSAAALGRIDATAWLLFALLVAWQMPHFFAIGWVHRRDYRAAGFPLRPAVDQTGDNTARWCVGYTLALLGISIAGYVLGVAGTLWLVTTSVAGAWMLCEALRFAKARDDRDVVARRLFRASLAYMPIALLAVVLER